MSYPLKPQDACTSRSGGLRCSWCTLPRCCGPFLGLGLFSRRGMCSLVGSRFAFFRLSFCTIGFLRRFRCGVSPARLRVLFFFRIGEPRLGGPIRLSVFCIVGFSRCLVFRFVSCTSLVLRSVWFLRISGFLPGIFCSTVSGLRPRLSFVLSRRTRLLCVQRFLVFCILGTLLCLRSLVYVPRLCRACRYHVFVSIGSPLFSW